MQPRDSSLNFLAIKDNAVICWGSMDMKRQIEIPRFILTHDETQAPMTVWHYPSGGSAVSISLVILNKSVR